MEKHLKYVWLEGKKSGMIENGEKIKKLKDRRDLEPVWTTKNHHSISVTQFPSLITHILSLITHHSNFHIRLPSSSNSYHSIFLTLFMDPTTVTVSASSVLLPACHFSHQYFFFLISSFPFSPVSLPKQKPKPRKMSQPPSPNQYHHHR